MSLYLKETEHGHNLAYWHSWDRFQQIEKPRDVLLQIKLDLYRLKTWSWLLPDIHDAVICQFLKLIHFHEEIVHIFDTFIQKRILRTFNREHFKGHSCIFGPHLVLEFVLIT